jgi:hypothetical protein
MTTTFSIFLFLGVSSPAASDAAPSSDVDTPAPDGEGEAATSDPDEPPTVRLEPESERPDEAHPAAGEAVGSEAGPGPRRNRRSGDSPDPVATHGGGVVADNGWGFQFNGYLNAPMQLGFGEHPNTGRTTLHAPLVPDDQFLSWQHTSHMRRGAQRKVDPARVNNARQTQSRKQQRRCTGGELRHLGPEMRVGRGLRVREQVADEQQIPHRQAQQPQSQRGSQSREKG